MASKPKGTRTPRGDTLYLKPSGKRESWFALTHDRANSLFSIYLLPDAAAAESVRRGIGAVPLGTCATYLKELGALLIKHQKVLCLAQAEHLRIRQYCRNRNIRLSETDAKRPAIERFAGYEFAESAADAKAISYLYGKLPEWLRRDEPMYAGIEQDVGTLRNADQSPKRIAAVVAQAGRGKLKTIPASVHDVTAFLQAAHRLARVQQALRLGKARALEELGGKDAALGDRVRTQRRTFFASGNASKKKTAEINRAKWRSMGQSLRLKRPGASDSWLAREIASKCGDKESTIRAAIPALGLKKKKPDRTPPVLTIPRRTVRAKA